MSRTTCFHCGGELVWSCDYDFEDLEESMYDDEGNEIKEGIVQLLHCSECGAEVTYKVPMKEETELEKSVSYIKQFCRENNCDDCKYYKKIKWI